jgi:hypothetical protein
MLVTISLLLCAATARAGDCSRTPSGDVVCKADGFDLLVKEAIKARADAKACGVQLADAQDEGKAVEAKFVACEAALATIPPCPPPPSLTRPLAGYGVGVLSTALMLAGILAPLPDQARLALGGAGLAGLAGGVVLVVWR